MSDSTAAKPSPTVEVWLRGPVDGVPQLLQPVAHALLQAVEELTTNLEGFPDELLWKRPGGMASAGFHLRHVSGVVDRLFTYARGEQLSPRQIEALRLETETPASPVTSRQLIEEYRAQVERAHEQLRLTAPAELASFRGVGRKQLPSTVQGLLFHSAEHVQRHVGQLLVTARWVQDQARAT